VKLHSVAQKISTVLAEVDGDLPLVEVEIGGVRAVFVRGNLGHLIRARVGKYCLGKFYIARGAVRFADGYDHIAQSKSGWRRVIGRTYDLCEKDLRENEALSRPIVAASVKLDATTTGDGRETSTVVITRHPALVAYLIETGAIAPGTTVLAHASPADVEGKRVIGVLPLHLAVLAASVVEVPLDLPPEARGRELTLAEVREYARPPVEYIVRDAGLARTVGASLRRAYEWARTGYDVDPGEIAQGIALLEVGEV
jgi:hypothetical protein